MRLLPHSSTSSPPKSFPIRLRFAPPSTKTGDISIPLPLPTPSPLLDLIGCFLSAPQHFSGPIHQVPRRLRVSCTQSVLRLPAELERDHYCQTKGVKDLATPCICTKKERRRVPCVFEKYLHFSPSFLYILSTVVLGKHMNLSSHLESWYVAPSESVLCSYHLRCRKSGC